MHKLRPSMQYRKYHTMRQIRVPEEHAFNGAAIHTPFGYLLIYRSDEHTTWPRACTMKK